MKLLMAAACCILDAGRRMLMLDAGSSMLGPGCWMLNDGHWMLDDGC